VALSVSGTLVAGLFVVDTAGAASSGSGGGRVIKTTAEAIHNLTPVTNIDDCNPNSLANIYDQLVRRMQTGKLVPGLATSWKAPNPSTFTMTLAPNVKFQDGTPFNSTAVAAGIKRDQTLPNSALKSVTSVISSIDTPNPTTVTLHLSSPVAGTMPSIFDGAAGEIPSPTAVAKYGTNYGVTTAVGAGPYQVTSFSANNTLSVTKFPGYWNKTAQKFGGITFVDMAQTTTTLDAPQVANGALTISGVKDANIAQVKGLSGVKYVASPTEQYAEIIFNSTQAPWNKLAVRQAVEYAINRQALVTALTTGLDKPAYQPLGPNAPGHTNSLDSLYSYNPSKAKKLLAQAGYKNGLPVQLGEIAYGYYERMSEAVQQMLNAVGFKVTLVPFAPTAVQTTLYTQKKFTAAITAFAPPNPGTYSVLYTSFDSQGAYNLAGTAPKGIDSGLAKAAATTNAKTQATQFKAVSKIIMKTALVAPIYFNDGITVYNPNMKNVVYGHTTCTQSNFLEKPYVSYGK